MEPITIEQLNEATARLMSEGHGSLPVYLSQHPEAQWQPLAGVDLVEGSLPLVVVLQGPGR